jgi:hypothetical protein
MLPLESFWIISGVLKTVVGRFLHAHALKFRFGKRFQPSKNLDAQIFRRGNRTAKHLNVFIERLVVERLKNFAFNEAIKIREIRNHSGGGIDFPRNKDFQNIIVPMSVRIIAFSVDEAVLFLAERRVVQAMRCRKAIAAAQFRFHFGVLRAGRYQAFVPSDPLR